MDLLAQRGSQSVLQDRGIETGAAVASLSHGYLQFLADPILQKLHLIPLSLAYWRQVILHDLVLPVIDLPVPYLLLLGIVHIIDIHPSVLAEVPHGEVIELLAKWFVAILVAAAL